MGGHAVVRGGRVRVILPGVRKGVVSVQGRLISPLRGLLVALPGVRESVISVQRRRVCSSCKRLITAYTTLL